MSGRKQGAGSHRLSSDSSNVPTRRRAIVPRPIGGRESHARQYGARFTKVALEKFMVNQYRLQGEKEIHR